MTPEVPPPSLKPLLPILDELLATIESVLLAGLTTSSKSTVERLDVSFKEVSRMRLLRLGATLRIVNEEVARFTGGSTQFSARRFSFFVGRTWWLATAMKRAIDAGDAAAFDRLMAAPAQVAADRVRVATLGVGKRVVAGAFAAFEFRLRAVAGSDETIPPGEPMVWSCVFPMRQGLDLPAEAFLQLPQKQKFKPSLLLEKRVVEVTRCAVSRSPSAGARLVLTDASTVQAGDAYNDWASLWRWDVAGAARRLANHRTSPLDLEIELQEEVFLDPWDAGASPGDGESHDVLAVSTESLPFRARIDHGPSGTPLRANLARLAKLKRRPPLFGVAHYESCGIVLQPLSVLRPDGPEYLTVSPDKISQAELVKAMKFT